MPLYEYQCVQCSDRVEIIQRMSDPPHSHCAKCGGDMKKLMSAPAIQFKGSGFYKTDYPKAGSKSAGTSTPASDKPADKPAEKPAEKKSESTAPAKSSD